MFSKILIACALLLVPLVINANIDSWCLDCICQLESNCRPLPCQWDGDAHSCGYYQIKYVYWKDCGSPGGSHEQCAADKSCSEQCIRNYMNRYARQCTAGRTPTCLDYARIHNGGPTGCVSPGTVWYGNRIASCYYG